MSNPPPLLELERKELETLKKLLQLNIDESDAASNQNKKIITASELKILRESSITLLRGEYCEEQVRDNNPDSNFVKCHTSS